MQILHFRKSHIDAVVELNREFEQYIADLSSGPRDSFDAHENKQKILRYCFWKEKLLSGYVAKMDGKIVGFVLYQYGIDPDEFRGKIIHMVDLFVTSNYRGKWVGRALMEKLQSHEDSLGLYFAVWKKNLSTIEFYKSIGAAWIDDVPYMKLLK